MARTSGQPRSRSGPGAHPLQDRHHDSAAARDADRGWIRRSFARATGPSDAGGRRRSRASAGLSDQATLDLARAVAALGLAALAAPFIGRALHVPDPISWAAVGIVARLVAPGLVAGLHAQLLLAVLLPGLVFGAAIGIRAELLRRHLATVAVLATVGVLASAAIVAVCLALAGVPMREAFVVGAVLAPTDPAAVVATLRRMRGREAVVTLIEGESLLNDGTSVVLFTIAAASVQPAAGADGAPLGAAVAGGTAFVVGIAGSVLVGLAAGLVAAPIVARTQDRSLAAGFALAVAYATYAVADGLGQSGLLATVAAGVVIGTQIRQLRTRPAIATTARGVAFVLTAYVFVIVGLTIDVATFGDEAVAIAAAFAGILVARAVLVGLAEVVERVRLGRWRAPEVGRAGEGLGPGWRTILYAAGIRGAVSVALALATPPATPDRTQLQVVAIGAIALSILVQGAAGHRIVGAGS